MNKVTYTQGTNFEVVVEMDSQVFTFTVDAVDQAAAKEKLLQELADMTTAVQTN